MAVDPQDKDFMVGLLNKMNGIDAGDFTSAPRASGPVSHSAGDEGKQDMINILNRLHAVTESTEPVPTMAPTIAPERVSVALQTERTQMGTRVGSWEIQIIKEERGDKIVDTYDVVHVTTGEPIAKALRMYEAAHGLVILLNRGEPLNGKSIRELLDLEETYTRNYIDAVRFRKRHAASSKAGKHAEADIFESRYMAARQHAMTAKERLSDLYESL